jgi:hypothetical protein
MTTTHMGRGQIYVYIYIYILLGAFEREPAAKKSRGLHWIE